VKKKKKLDISHRFVAVPLSNHAFETDMIHDIIHALDETISTPLTSFSSDFIQVRCRHHVQLNVQVFEVPLRKR